MRKSSVIGILVVTGLVAAQLGLVQTLRTTEGAWVDPPVDRTSRWNTELFRMLAFGHIPVASDWLWLKTLQDPAIQHVAPGFHPAAYFDLDLATDLDPMFMPLYTAGANMLSIIRDDNVGARDLLRKGEEYRKQHLPHMPREFREEHWGKQWMIPFALAYVYLFEFSDLLTASHYYAEASVQPGAPAYLSSLVRRLEKPGGKFEVGLRLLNFMIAANRDPRALETLERKRVWLGLAQYLFETNQSFDAFLAKRKIGPSQRAAHWDRFIRDRNPSRRDPWGGQLFLKADGRVESTLPRQKVLGLE